MKKLEEIIESLKEGSIFTIKKYFYGENNSDYSSCIAIYDGRIFKDVKAVEIRDFLLNIPNIKEKIDCGYTYYVKYNTENKTFENIITSEITNNKYTEVSKYNTVDDLITISPSLFDGLIELETKIVNSKSKVNMVKCLLVN